MAHYTVTVISKRYIAQEHVSAEAKVYLVLMYVLDIHDFSPNLAVLLHREFILMRQVIRQSLKHC